MFSLILRRRPSYCWFDCEAFWCANGKIQIGSLVADLHVGIKGKDENLKAVCLGAQPSTGTSSEKKRKSQSKQYLPLWWESGSASIPPFIVPSSADTAKLKDCSYVFTEASSPPIPSQIWGYSISTVSLWKQPSSWGTGERKKNTSGQWNCLVTQKGVIIEINHPILFHNWTLPRLTFQWHLPSSLSYHMHSPNSSFVCQENSEPPLVGLVWQCNLHKKFP